MEHDKKGTEASNPDWVDVIGASITALILFGILWGFLMLFGVSGGRYTLAAVLFVTVLIGWGWWKLVCKSPTEASDNSEN